MRDYEKLEVYQMAEDLVVEVYQLTSSFPSEERFGISTHLRKTALSVPSNIAEGQARHSTGEFVQFISHAEGSVAELHTQLLLSVELGFCSRDQTTKAMDLLRDLRRMLNGLRRKLQSR